MKFTLNWLKEFVTVKASPEKLAELLTMAGLEVESLSSLHETEANREDWLFEISVTPNRGDCLGITGLANEVAALTGGRVKSAAAPHRSRGSITANRVTIAIYESAMKSCGPRVVRTTVQIAPRAIVPSARSVPRVGLGGFGRNPWIFGDIAR